MRLLRGEEGLTLFEVTISLVIAGIILVPLSAIISGQLRIPFKISSELGASRQIQQATLILTEDASIAESFAAGTQPDYGTFSWTEASTGSPVAVTARYYWDDDKVYRLLTRAGEASPADVVVDPVPEFGDVTFQYSAPGWTYDGDSKTWSYAEGKVDISVTTTREAGADFADTVFSGNLVADLRPQAERAVSLPEQLSAPPTPAPTATPTATPIPTSTPTPTPTPVPTWTALANTPFNVRFGGALTSDGTDLYAFRGAATTHFWKFEVSGGSWSSLSSAPQKVDSGGALVHASGYVYAFRGAATTDFWRYNISGAAWETRTSAPQAVDWGGALAWDGADSIYALRGNTSTDFWKYSISGNSWSALTSAPTTVHAGGALAYVSGDVYATRGNTTTTFWKYNVSGNSWSTLATAPETLEEGGSLAWAGGDLIYALRGNVNANFWSYSISGNSWTNEQSTPANVDDGGALTYLSGNFYALRGDNVGNQHKWDRLGPEKIIIMKSCVGAP